MTMCAALARAACHFGPRSAMVAKDGSKTTWRDHVDRVARLAAGLRMIGAEPGSRFAILAPNSLHQAELIHAGYWSGSIPVPLNFRLALPELATIIQESGAGILFVDDMFAQVAEDLKSNGWSGDIWQLGEGGARSTGQLISSHEALDPCAVDETDEAMLLFTGGTTGQGKGVPLSHRNIVSNGLQVGLALSVVPSDVMLHVAPMFHSADLLGTAITLAGGAHSYLGQPAPDTFAAAVERRGISFTMIPPVLLHGLVHGGLLGSSDLSGLRIFISGGAPVPFDLLKAAQEALPQGSMVQGYGLTETSPILTFMHLRQTEQATGSDSQSCHSAGLPLAGVETMLSGLDGRQAADGEPGELQVRGPNVFAGYPNRPDDTAAAFHDGWFRTGDVARIDQDGFIHIIDRQKDVIITGGENVYSTEVETVLAAHPNISEVAVIGVADDKWGEQVVAIVVAKSGEVDDQEAIDFCRGKIAGYKIPRKTICVRELPKTPLGKVLKTTLREKYANSSG